MDGEQTLTEAPERSSTNWPIAKSGIQKQQVTKKDLLGRESIFAMLAIRTAAIPVKTCTTVWMQMVQRNVAEEDVQAQQYHALHVNKIYMGCTLRGMKRLVLLHVNGTPVPLCLNNLIHKKYSHIHSETNRAALKCATQHWIVVVMIILYPVQCGIHASCTN